MADIIIMPKLGFNMSEGKLVQWYKSEGESVKKGEALFSVETDKTNMDIEATDDGVVRKLFIDEGNQIPVTLPIAIVGTADENIDDLVADSLAQLSDAGAETSSGSGESATAEVSVSQSSSSEEKAAEAAGGMTAASGEARTASACGGDGFVKISPRARRIAEENGLVPDDLSIAGTGFDGGICEKDILTYLENNKIKASPVAKVMAEVEGVNLAGLTVSGAGGKIMKVDVTRALSSASSAHPAQGEVTPDGKEILEEVPYAGVRKIIGDRLAESKFTAPHLYFTQKVNLEKLLNTRKQVNEVQGKKTSVTDYIARACVIALQKYPDMNASLIDQTIVKYRSVNLGIAVASPTGLIVPNIKNAQYMSVVELSNASTPLFDKAREGKLGVDEYSGGTFTISNLGMFGIENFTAIINPPEVGILAISSTKDEPLVVVGADGTKSVEIKPMMNIQLTVDHRLIDGLLAAQFVTEIKNLLETPISLLV